MNVKEIFWHFMGERSYSDEAQEVFARMSTPLTPALKNAYADFIDSQVASGNWDKILAFCYAGSNTQANSLTDWKGLITPTLNGDSHWTPYSDWYTQGTSGDFIGTGFIPNDVAAFGLNDAGAGFMIKFNNSINSGSKIALGVLEATNTRQIGITQSGTAGTSITCRINSLNTLTGTDANGCFDNNSLYTIARTSAVNVDLYKNGVSIASSGANTSGGKATIEVYLGARNNAGTSETFIDASYKCFFFIQAVGFNHQNFYDNLVILNAAVDAIVPNIPFFMVRGQSNAAGRGEVNRLVALTPYVADQLGSKIYYKSTVDTTDNGSWRKMILGVNNNEVELEALQNVFGLEGALGKILLDNKNIPLYFSKTAQGGASLAQVVGTYNDWDPSSGATDYYDVATDGYDLPALADLVAEYPNKNIKPVLFWLQGETDKDVPASLAAYASNFTAFVTAWRAENALFATAPLIIAKLHYELDANEATINAIFDTYAASNPNVYVIDPGSQVTYPRKVDLPAEIKAAYPPTHIDDNHNSYEFHVKSSELVYAKLVEIGYI